MLRSVKNACLNPRINTYIYSRSGTSTTVSVGKADILSTTANDVGDTTLEFSNNFARTPVVIGCPATLLDTSGPYVACSARSSQQMRLVSVQNNGTQANGLVHVAVFGWDSAYITAAGLLQTIYHSAKRIRILPFRLSDPSTLVEGKYHASVSGSGEQSTLTFYRAFSQAPVVLGIGAADGVGVSVTSTAVNRVVVRQYDTDGNPTTGPIDLLVIGSDGPFESLGNRSPIKCPQIGTRIVAANITVSGGTPSVSGYPDVTVQDDGVGLFTLTFATPFKREPVIVATESSSGPVACTARTSSSFTIQCRNHAGTATDPATVGFIAVGFDRSEQQA